MLCDRKSCTKAYHLPCLGLGKRPFGGSPARAAEARPLGAALGGRQGLGEGAGRSCLGVRGPHAWVSAGKTRRGWGWGWTLPFREMTGSGVYRAAVSPREGSREALTRRQKQKS